MKKNGSKLLVGVAAAAIVALWSCPACAAWMGGGGGGGNNFSSIARNIAGSIENLPSLVAGLGYLFGILLGVLGVLKLKDHVENPGQTPLKDGAIRLAAGGALFALPMVYESMTNTIGRDGVGASVAYLAPVAFGGGF